MGHDESWDAQVLRPIRMDLMGEICYILDIIFTN